MPAHREIHANTPQEVDRLIAENHAADIAARLARQPAPPPPPPDPRIITRNWLKLELMAVLLVLAYAALYCFLLSQIPTGEAARRLSLAAFFIVPLAFIGITVWVWSACVAQIAILHLLHVLNVPLRLNALVTIPGVPALWLLAMYLLSHF